LLLYGGHGVFGDPESSVMVDTGEFEFSYGAFLAICYVSRIWFGLGSAWKGCEISKMLVKV
jgi:hypothetical protein